MKHLWIVVAAGMIWVNAGLGETPGAAVGAAPAPTAASQPTLQPSTQAVSMQSTAMAQEAEVRKSLGLLVNDIQMQHLPLLEAFDRVRELSNQNIYVDVKALRGEGVTTSAKVTYKADKVTLGTMLTEIIKPLSDSKNSVLGFDVVGKSIAISTKGRLRDLVVQYHTDVYKLGDSAVGKILGTVIEDIKIDRMPFRDAIAKLAKMTSQTIKLDKDSVIAAGVSLETPVSLQGKGLTLGQALRLALHDAEGNAPLDYIVQDGTITVFGPAPQ
jgi:hypothetical protein